MMTFPPCNAGLHSLPSELLEYLTFEPKAFGLNARDVANLAMSSKTLSEAVAKPLFYRHLLCRAERAVSLFNAAPFYLVDDLLVRANNLPATQKTKLLEFFIERLYLYAPTDPTLPRFYTQTNNVRVAYPSLNDALHSHIDQLIDPSVKSRLSECLEQRLNLPTAQSQAVRRIYGLLREAASNTAGCRKSAKLKEVFDALTEQPGFPGDFFSSTFCNVLQISNDIHAGGSLRKLFEPLLNYAKIKIPREHFPALLNRMYAQALSVKSLSQRCNILIYLINNFAVSLSSENCYRFFQELLKLAPHFHNHDIRYRFLRSLGRSLLNWLPKEKLNSAFITLLRHCVPVFAAENALPNAEENLRLRTEVVSLETAHYEHLLTYCFDLVSLDYRTEAFVHLRDYAQKHPVERAQSILLGTLVRKIVAKLPLRVHSEAIKDILTIADNWQKKIHKSALLQELADCRYRLWWPKKHETSLAKALENFAARHDISLIL